MLRRPSHGPGDDATLPAELADVDQADAGLVLKDAPDRARHLVREVPDLDGQAAAEATQGRDEVEGEPGVEVAAGDDEDAVVAVYESVRTAARKQCTPQGR